MELIANRPLTGTNYRADPGEVFNVPREVAQKLMSRGLASIPPPPEEPADFEVSSTLPDLRDASVTDPIEDVIQQQSKMIGNYENKMVRTEETKPKRGLRFPGIPTPCPKCSLLCPSKRAAKEHCK